MKRYIGLIIIALLSFGAVAQEVVSSYDFNSLNEGDLDGQDNWATILHNTGPTDFLVSLSEGGVISPDGTQAIFYNSSGAGYGRTATRKASGNFDYDFTSANVVEYEIDMNAAYWDTYFGVGFDADGDGHIAPGLSSEENDGGIVIHGAGNGDRVELPNGTVVDFTTDDNSGWVRYKVILDFTANDGAGSVALFIDPGMTGDYTPVNEVQGVNMGLTEGSGDLQDRTVWDGVFMHSQGMTGAFDNITITEQNSDLQLQFIEFAAISNKLTTGDDFELDASATSGLDVIFELTDGPATLSGNTVSLTGNAGIVTIKASQPGDGTWAAAPDVYQTFEVVDPTAYTPELIIRRPYNGTNVYLTSLDPVLIVASTYIDHPEVLNIVSVNCNVDGDQDIQLEEKMVGSGYYLAEWTPPAYGSYTMTITSESTGNMETAETVSFEVTDQVTNLEVQTFDQVQVNSENSTVQDEFVFPTYAGAFNNMTAFLDVTCPPGGCDPWDRVGGMEARGPTGEWVEILRYITPYGVPCDHQIDVTDYASIFQGLVEMRFNIGGVDDDGFLVDVAVNFEEGTPAYKYSWVNAIWKDTYSFGDYENLQPVEVINWTFDNHIEASKLKVLNTGHGWGDLNSQNAAEFYEATHQIKLNGDSFDQHLWVTCNPNPDGCQPQNGTWYHNRAGWCPGSISHVYEYDVTPYVNSADVTIEYKFGDYVDYCHPNHPDCVTGVTCDNCESGFNPHYIISGNLVSYSNQIIVSTEKVKQDLGLKVTPNPSNGIMEMTINQSQLQDNATVQIFNISGQLQQQFSWNGDNRMLNLQGYASGVYILKVFTKLGSEVQKLVIE